MYKIISIAPLVFGLLAMSLGLAGCGTPPGRSYRPTPLEVAWQEPQDGSVISFCGSSSRFGDFNGDGNADLAVGVPRAKIQQEENTGKVIVLYGTPVWGLSTADNQTWHLGYPIFEVDLQEDAHFGSALAAGNFNGDEYTDLAVGVPGAEVQGLANAGAVIVIFGSPDGLIWDGAQTWHQGDVGVSSPQENARFGSVLAVGNFNGDGHGDLAVGIPGYDGWIHDGKAADMGAVGIFYGSSTGLTATDSKLWNENTGIRGFAKPYDYFGSALAVGNFNGDQCDDLAIGVPGKDITSQGSVVYNAGSVVVLYGRREYGTIPGGICGTNNQIWRQGVNSFSGQSQQGTIEDTPERDDNFGLSLAAGDFDKDGYADLAIGVPYEDVGSIEDAGAVNVLFGSHGEYGGLQTDRNQFWHQDVQDVQGDAKANDYFGWALASGDFDANGHADLAIGVPGGDVGSLQNLGVVNVLYSWNEGLFSTSDVVEGFPATGVNNQMWYQGKVVGSCTVKGEAESGDCFGLALAVGNFNGDRLGTRGVDDLVVGVPMEDVAGRADAGAVNVIYGGIDYGLGSTYGCKDQIWHLDKEGIPGLMRSGDRFGAALAGGGS